MSGPGETGFAAGGRAGDSPSGPHGLHEVELVGAHLRVRGHLALGRFPRLADLVNHDRGVIVLHDATLLDGAGNPTSVPLPELVVSQDEVTFIGHAGEAGPGHTGAASTGSGGRLVLVTAGHTISGAIHRVRDISLANFLSATDPRFFEVSDAMARSRHAPTAPIRHRCLLVNRTQVGAIAELPEGAPDPADVGSAAESGA